MPTSLFEINVVDERFLGGGTLEFLALWKLKRKAKGVVIGK